MCEQEKTETLEQVFEKLKEALKEDREYAHAWHCNLAMSFSDAIPEEVRVRGMKHQMCNDGASRFMMTCFGVETSNDMLDEVKKNDH